MTESGSEYSTFTWVEESEGDEDEESLSEKPWTPVTAVGAAVGVSAYIILHPVLSNTSTIRR